MIAVVRYVVLLSLLGFLLGSYLAQAYFPVDRAGVVALYHALAGAAIGSVLLPALVILSATLPYLTVVTLATIRQACAALERENRWWLMGFVYGLGYCLSEVVFFDPPLPWWLIPIQGFVIGVGSLCGTAVMVFCSLLLFLLILLPAGILYCVLMYDDER